MASSPIPCAVRLAGRLSTPATMDEGGGRASVVMLSTRARILAYAEETDNVDMIAAGMTG